ncbi:enoyl-CoA hydratase/isomerase family protein [Sneathiella chinensis]|uniref:3-hydroxyisobutyryl-CoA hydrolase n=1 Tax=Sneathiella chinensis TaxID=349750 RepID=A0ABQ5U5A6_9PROT|nr:enoyl-CoA hydratase/isomerase family protein [Sneathiella chinensis]GLQ06459.1 enoyl-CoA hydratase [Sneathiella chinensis]
MSEEQKQEQEIIFEIRGQMGVITLNRPKALNALTHEMAVALDAQLVEWADDPAVQAVLVKGAGEKAFCAGGDIVRLYNEGKSGGDYPYQFYRDEYVCNARVKHFPKPYIAFLDGIVMGGGVGVSVHGSHRIATEKTLFAMPETGIGLFPDVGGTYFLPRCPGEVGMYLGLTGDRLKAADTVYAEITTGFVASENLQALENALVSMEFSGNSFVQVNQLIKAYEEDPGEAPLQVLQAQIDAHFSKGSVEDILTSLEAAGDAWAMRVAASLKSKSPTALKLAFRQLREGAKAEFDECMQMEWRMVNRVIKGTEFYEGTRAVLIDRDQSPKWNPATLEDVHEADIDAYFAPLEVGELDI